MSPGQVDLIHDNLLLTHDFSILFWHTASQNGPPSRAGEQGFGPPSGPGWHGLLRPRGPTDTGAALLQLSGW
jgi:hypothetical protein